MTIDNKIRDERLPYDINREATKISVLSSGKIEQYEYLIGEKVKDNQRQIAEQAKFAYSTLGKALGKQTEKQIGALKPLDISNEKYELKQIKGIFPKHLMNDLIRVKLKEIVNFQYIIKKDDLNYKSKRGKTYNFSKYPLPIVFKEIYMKDIYH